MGYETSIRFPRLAFFGLGLGFYGTHIRSAEIWFRLICYERKKYCLFAKNTVKVMLKNRTTYSFSGNLNICHPLSLLRMTVLE